MFAYDNLVPALLETTVLTFFAIIALSDDVRYRRSKGNPPASGVLELILYSVFLIAVSLPATIITYRYVLSVPAFSKGCVLDICY